eukprot:gene32148-41683_t
MSTVYDENPFAEAQEEEFTFTTPFVSKGKEVPPPPPSWLRSDESKSSLPTSSGNPSEGATTVAGTEAIQISKIIALNFGFMYNAKSRSVFMLFIGTILFSFSLFGRIIGVCMLANAGFNLYIIFRYPEYEKIQRDDALSEIKGFLAANPAFATTMVDAGLQASSEIIKSNPELARKGAEALVFGRSNSSQAGSKGEDYTTV